MRNLHSYISVSRDGVLWNSSLKDGPRVAVATVELGLEVESPSDRRVRVFFASRSEDRALFVERVRVDGVEYDTTSFLSKFGVSESELGRWIRRKVDCVAKTVLAAERVIAHNRDLLATPARARNPDSRMVLEALQQGSYRYDGAEVTISAAQHEAEAQTRLFTPGQLDTLRGRFAEVASAEMSLVGKVSVTDETTQEAARRMAQGAHVALLNFASARSVGGGFLGGARAQEEELCRSSGLFRALPTQPSYYLENRRYGPATYTDHAILSPSVPFFRLGTGKPWLQRPFLASVITMPAPNRKALTQQHSPLVHQLGEIFERRWSNVLAIADSVGTRNLVLGAWGCGAFRNDPKTVAGALRRVLGKSTGRFEEIVVAIPNRGEIGKRNHQAFRDALASPS